MTCRMAAGQQKRRLSNSNLHEPIKGKKKRRPDSSDYTLSLRPHVDLDWDERRKRVLPKKEQVGLAWKDLGPFVDTVPQPCKGLADVFHVPKEIFGLKDLSEVLSYEVWASCLSESDRKLLSQFLPSGVGTSQAVRSLLEGENLHFGNQFTKWSSSVCRGNMHPDAVLQREKRFLSDKKAYYVELSNYHSSMIENLERWKDKWINCKDPEKLFRDTPTKHKPGSIASPPEKPKANKREVVQRIVRTSDTAKYMSYVKISKSQFEQVKNLKQSGEGFLPKLLNPVLGDIKSLEIKPYESLVDEDKTRLHSHWLQLAKEDLPVSFEAWKGKNLEIQQLKKALIVEIPAGFEAWRERKAENEQLTESSSTDVDDDRTSDMEEDMNSHELERTEQAMIGGEHENSSSTDVSEEQEELVEAEEEHEGELQLEEGVEEEREEEDEEIEEEEDDEDDDDDDDGNEGEDAEAEAEMELEVEPKQVENLEDVDAVEGNFIDEDVPEEEEEEEAEADEIKEPVPLDEEHHNLTNESSYCHDLERIPPLNSHHQDPSTPSGTNNVLPVNTPSELAEPFPCDEIDQPSDSDKWVPVDDYRQHQQEYMQPPESSLKLPELIPRQHSGGGVSNVMDLKRNAMEMDNSASIFCPELIPSFQKEPDMLAPSYSHGSLNGMKQQVPGLPSFLLASEHPPQTLQAQRRLLEQRQQVRDNNLYMHQQQQSLNRPSMYPTSSYPNQGHLPSMVPTRQNMNANVNMTNNNLRFPVNNTGYTWLPQEHQMHANTSNTNSWSGMDTSTSTSDGSLYSVLSECNKIPPRMQYQSMNPAEQYTTPRSFGMAGGGGGGVDNMYGYINPQLGSNNNNNNSNSNINNRSNNASTAAGTMDSLAWMNFRNQNPNPGMPDSMARTFPKPWNQ